MKQKVKQPMDWKALILTLVVLGVMFACGWLARSGYKGGC